MRYLPLLFPLLFVSPIYADTFETESNNGPELSDALAIGAITTGQLQSIFDVDWFQFEVDDTDETLFFDITFTDGGNDDFGLVIYDDQENMLAHLLTSTTVTEINEFGEEFQGVRMQYTLGFATTGTHYAVIYSPKSYQVEGDADTSVGWITAPYYIETRMSESPNGYQLNLCDIDGDGVRNADDVNFKREIFNILIDEWETQCGIEN